MAQYLALEALSSGLCNTLLTQSAYHARWQQQHPDNDSTPESDLGTAIHDCLLEGVDRIAAIDAPDWRTKAAKEAREAARAEGKIPMLAHKVARVEEAVKAAKAFLPTSELAGAFESGKPEQTVIWQEDSMLCKARPDWLSDKWHISVKTTDGSANPESWIRRQLTPMGYDVALIFYERGLRAHNLNVQSRILVIEQNPPYGCCVIGLAPSKRDYADGRVERAINVWKKCAASGRYPAYPTETCFAEAQPWEMAHELEAELSRPVGEVDEMQEKYGGQA